MRRSYRSLDGLEPEADFRSGDIVLMGGTHHLVDCSEHLLCKSATFDAAGSENAPELRWRLPKAKRVTCPVCLGIIALVKSYLGRR